MNRRPLIVAFLALLITWQVAVQIPQSLHPCQDSWGLTDWLINYSGGFVRRGLAGTALWWTSAITEIPGHYLAIAASLASYGFLVHWLLTATRRYFPPTLVLSCVMLGFPAFQSTLIRKDSLLLLLFAACLRCLLSNHGSVIKWLLINLCACSAILIHETFAFFAIPALALCRHPLLALSRTRRIAALLPSIACFGMVTWHHGTPETAEAIHQSWMPLWQQACLSPTDYQDPFSTIQSIGWTTTEGVSMTRGIFSTGLYQPVAWLMVTAISFALMILFVRTDGNRGSRNRLACLLCFQLVFISPLFLLGVDYGRWLFFGTVSSAMLLSSGFSAPLPPCPWPVRLRGDARLHHYLMIIPRHEWLLLFFGIPVLWSAHNFLTASPVGRVIDAILAIHSGR